MKYRYSDDAKLELIDASGYYDLQRPGLGTEFAVEVGIGIAKVLETPASWPEIDSGFRRYRVDRFPYALSTGLMRPEQSRSSRFSTCVAGRGPGGET